jgi:hypothetical protein
LNKYLNIPVKTLLKLEEFSLVDNYTKEERTNMNLSTIVILEVYDRIVENKE